MHRGYTKQSKKLILAIFRSVFIRKYSGKIQIILVMLAPKLDTLTFMGVVLGGMALPPPPIFHERGSTSLII